MASTSSDSPSTGSDPASTSSGSSGPGADDTTSAPDDSTSTTDGTTDGGSSSDDGTTDGGAEVVHAEIVAQIHADDNPTQGEYRFLFGMMRDPAPEIEDEATWSVSIEAELDAFTNDLDNLWRSGPVDYANPPALIPGSADPLVWDSIHEMALDDLDDVVIYGETVELGDGYGILYQARRESWLYEPLPSLDDVRWVVVEHPELRGFQQVLVQLIGTE